MDSNFELTFDIILDDLDRLFELNAYNKFTYSADEIMDFVKRVFDYEKSEDERLNGILKSIVKEKK